MIRASSPSGTWAWVNVRARSSRSPSSTWQPPRRRCLKPQVQLEEGHHERADRLAYGTMLVAAKGLIKTEFVDISDDPDEIIREFRARFFDTKLFFDTYAGGKFAMYLFRRHEATGRAVTAAMARELIEEAQLFLEASHACQARLAAVSNPLFRRRRPPRLPNLR